MTRRFVDRDDIHHVVADERELVTALHNSARIKAADDATFMKLMAVRMEVTTGKPCRSDTPEHFIADLLTLEAIREE